MRDGGRRTEAAAAVAARRRRIETATAVTQELTEAGWQTIPSTYVI
jgi:hypothetical protein